MLDVAASGLSSPTMTLPNLFAFTEGKDESLELLAVAMSLCHTFLQGRTRQACAHCLNPLLVLGSLLVPWHHGDDGTAELGG